METNIAVALLAGVFGLLPVLLQWMSERSKSRVRDRQVTRLQSELDFLEHWAKLSGSGAADGATVSPDIQPQLDRLLAQYDELKHTEMHPEERSTEVGFARRMILAYTPSGPLAWAAHTIFYVLVIFSVTMVITDIADLVGGKPADEVLLGTGLALIGVFILPPMIVLQRIAERQRRKALEAAGNKA